MMRIPTSTTDESLISKIYILRNQRIMFDRDLAELYGVPSRRLREQVKRNMERFPENFMFQLTEEEVVLMVSHFAIPSKQQLGGALPYAFTEHGVLMLANVIKSDQAVKMSIRIIEIFVKIREMVLSHKDIMLKIEQLERKVVNNTDEIAVIFNALKKLLYPPDEPRERMGFKKD